MEQYERGTKYSNRRAQNKRFKNIGSRVPRRKWSIWLAIKWECRRIWEGRPFEPEGGYSGFAKKWYHPCNMAQKLQDLRQQEALTASPPADRVFWIGHASQLLCVHNGLNIIFDPIFSFRASPVYFCGPGRCYKAATTIDELPRIDVVVISHNHYDHFDKRSIKAIFKRFPDVHFMVPLKVERHLKKWGIPLTSCTSLDWWEETRVRDVTFALTPAQHNSCRSPFDFNHDLWGGWCVGWKPYEYSHRKDHEPLESYSSGALYQTSRSDSEAEAPATDWNALKTYYFTGDTAFNEDVFIEIHKHYPRIALAALPIGAYDPRESLGSAHVDPEQAVEIFKILQPQLAYGVHWGTFELGDESIEEPPALLKECLADAGLSEDVFINIPMGECIEF